MKRTRKLKKRVSEKPQELNKKVHCLKGKGENQKLPNLRLIMVKKKKKPEKVLHMFYIFIHHAVYFAYPNSDFIASHLRKRKLH